MIAVLNGRSFTNYSINMPIACMILIAYSDGALLPRLTYSSENIRHQRIDLTRKHPPNSDSIAANTDDNTSDDNASDDSSELSPSTSFSK